MALTRLVVKTEGQAGTMTGTDIEAAVNSTMDELEGSVDSVTLTSQMTVDGRLYHLTVDDGGATKGLYIKFTASVQQIVAEV